MVLKLAKLANRLARLRTMFAAIVLVSACTADDQVTDVAVEQASQTPTRNIDPSSLLPSQDIARTGYHVTPAGTQQGDGSETMPWDLVTALRGGNGRIQPNDTVWVHGGTYVGSFNSTLTGAPGAPVVIRQFPGERAILDAAGSSSGSSTLVVRGEWTVIWGLEVTNSDPQRFTQSLANNVRPNSVVNYASHTRFVELVVHDGGVGFHTERTASDVEIIDCIFYNNGWQAPDRGHGHGIYLKSDAGSVSARGNIIFNQFGYGIHAYTNSGSGALNGIRLEGNVAFNNGTLADNSTSANILLGGGEPVRAGVVEENLTWFTPGYGGTNVQLGYSSYVNDDIAVSRNLFAGGGPVLRLGHWQRATLENNVLFGTAQLVSLLNRTGSYDWKDTHHYQDPAFRAWASDGTSYDWYAWRSVTGFGASDIVFPAAPATSQVIVRPHHYDTNRATLVVYNWAMQSAVTADLSSILKPGANFEIRNVQDLFGTPVLSGTWTGGDIALPLVPAIPPAPHGFGTSPAPITGPNFDVFLVVAS